MRIRRDRLVVVAVAAIVVFGCGAGALRSGRAVAKAHSATANATVAHADAASLLTRLVLPPGAQPSAGEPAGDGSVLAAPGTSPATPNLVDDHRWWILPGQRQTVLGYLDAQPPAGSAPSLTGSGTAGARRVSFSVVGFSWGAITGVLSTRWLVVEVVALPGPRTGLRVDAEMVWITPRPASERIPAGTRRLQVSVDRGTAILQGPFQVTSPRRIRRAVKLLNYLPAAQPGTESCPADWGSRISLAFYTDRSTTPVAVAIIDPGGCEGVQLTIRGRHEPLLTGAASPGSGISTHRSLIGWLDSDLGVNLATGVPAGSPLGR